MQLNKNLDAAFAHEIVGLLWSVVTAFSGLSSLKDSGVHFDAEGGIPWPGQYGSISNKEPGVEDLRGGMFLRSIRTR